MHTDDQSELSEKNENYRECKCCMKLAHLNLWETFRTELWTPSGCVRWEPHKARPSSRIAYLSCRSGDSEPRPYGDRSLQDKWLTAGVKNLARMKQPGSKKTFISLAPRLSNDTAHHHRIGGQEFQQPAGVSGWWKMPQILLVHTQRNAEKKWFPWHSHKNCLSQVVQIKRQGVTSAAGLQAILAQWRNASKMMRWQSVSKSGRIMMNRGSFSCSSYTCTYSYAFIQNDDFLPVWQLTPKRPRARQSGIRTIAFSCRRVSWRKWISIESLKVPPDSKPMVQHTSSLRKIKNNPIHAFSKRITYSLYVIEKTWKKKLLESMLRRFAPCDLLDQAISIWLQLRPTSHKLLQGSGHPPRTPWSFDTDMHYQCAVGCCRHLRPRGSSRQLLDVWRDSPAGRPDRQAKTRPNFPTVKLHHHWPLLWFHKETILKSRQSFCSTTFPIVNESLFELISW